MTPINVLSLFDGISCGQIALARAGIPVNQYFASEIDKHAIKVTQHNWPDTIQLGSVTDLKHIDWLNPKIDLLIGGSPCQGFSFAGKQLNFNDPRSALFFEYVRILKEIQLVNPNVKFFLENVKMKKEYQDVITTYLGVEPIRVNSELLSAGLRDRLYWTNIKGFVMPSQKNIKVSDILQDNVGEDYNLSGKAIAYMNRLRNGKPRWEYHKFPLNGKAGCLTASSAKGIPYTAIEELKRHITPVEAERLMTVPDNYTSEIPKSKRFGALGNGWTVDVIVEFFKHLKSPENV